MLSLIFKNIFSDRMFSSLSASLSKQFLMTALIIC